jgi:hypothetical protein
MKHFYEGLKEVFNVKGNKEASVSYFFDSHCLWCQMAALVGKVLDAEKVHGRMLNRSKKALEGKVASDRTEFRHVRLQIQKLEKPTEPPSGSSGEDIDAYHEALNRFKDKSVRSPNFSIVLISMM